MYLYFLSYIFILYYYRIFSAYICILYYYHIFCLIFVSYTIIVYFALYLYLILLSNIFTSYLHLIPLSYIHILHFYLIFCSYNFYYIIFSNALSTLLSMIYLILLTHINISHKIVCTQISLYLVYFLIRNNINH